MFENPTIALSGVRISWLMFARNALFRRLDSSAFSLAEISSCSICLRIEITSDEPISVSGLPGSVAGIHGSLYFHPVEVRTAGVGHAVLFADFRDFPLNQVPVGLFDAFAVLFVYFGEIGRFGHRKSVLVDILATHQFHRTVYVA